jgi:hypothetical protein
MNEELQYIKAFNCGYIMEVYEPVLLQAIIQKLNPTTNYLEGLFAGKSQFNYEKDKAKLSTLAALRIQSKDQYKELDRE